MAETRDEFEEAWARIVEDLTRRDPEGDGATGTEALLDTSALFDTHPDDPGAPAAPEVPSDRGDPADPGSLADPGVPTDPGVPSDSVASADPPTGAARVDPGIAALFEPLHREQPAPGAFVDNWDDEGHFVPPVPPELPEGTPVKRLAWAGTLGGPAVLILGAMSGWDPPAVVNLSAGLAFLAGFATLVWQLPETREDGWDDGARL